MKDANGQWEEITRPSVYSKHLFISTEGRRELKRDDRKTPKIHKHQPEIKEGEKNGFMNIYIFKKCITINQGWCKVEKQISRSHDEPSKMNK